MMRKEEFVMTMDLVRRTLLGIPAWACFPVRQSFAASEPDELITRLFGRTATYSPSVRLQMPAVFGNGYSVPLTLEADSPMTEANHVRALLVLAPGNPIPVVANFQFTPASGRAAITTRIRLSQPQAVIAIADMSDGALLMARSWVKVDTDGCG